jgi:hypothetical protein
LPRNLQTRIGLDCEQRVKIGHADIAKQPEGGRERRRRAESGPG